MSDDWPSLADLENLSNSVGTCDADLTIADVMQAMQEVGERQREHAEEMRAARDEAYLLRLRMEQLALNALPAIVSDRARRPDAPATERAAPHPHGEEAEAGVVDGPYRGFVELPRAVFDALHESLEVVVGHALKEQERIRVGPRRPSIFTALESDGVGVFWRNMAPKAQLEYARDADDAAVTLQARCICGGRKAQVTVSDHALVDCHRGVVADMISRLLERLATGVNRCHCVIREPR